MNLSDHTFCFLLASRFYVPYGGIYTGQFLLYYSLCALWPKRFAYLCGLFPTSWRWLLICGLHYTRVIVHGSLLSTYPHMCTSIRLFNAKSRHVFEHLKLAINKYTRLFLHLRKIVLRGDASVSVHDDDIWALMSTPCKRRRTLLTLLSGLWTPVVTVEEFSMRRLPSDRCPTSNWLICLLTAP